MKTVNKTEYPLVDELINELLDKFKKQEWQFPDNLPEIYLSDEIIQLPINKNGLQGRYPNIKMSPPNNNEASLLSDYKYEAETPMIIIYEKVLFETAKELEEKEIENGKKLHLKQEGIKNDYGISFEEAKMSLFYCAVLNEISKWILVDTPQKDTWKDNPLNKKDHLHECLTAILSYWICEKRSPELKKSFDFLMSLHKKGQNNIGEYNRYSEYDAFEILTFVINCVAICRKKSYEYFELLDLLLKISKYDNTPLDYNNFPTVIVNNDVQKIVEMTYKEQIAKVPVDIRLTDILFEIITNKGRYPGSEAGKHYGI